MAEESKAKGNITKVFVFVVIAVVVFGVAGVGVYFYQQYQKTDLLKKNPTLAGQQDQKALIEKVGKLIHLPTTEQPTIATVSDVTKLKDQPFFVNAKNGYKVLIYPKARKAILYDPVSNKIIDVGPVNLSDQGSPSPATSQEPLNIVLYNGTKTVGFASLVEKQLKEKAPNVTVVKKGNARQDYKKTLVVDLVGTKKTAASQLAKLLSGEVGDLPKGEIKPSNAANAASASAEILVILGKE